MAIVMFVAVWSRLPPVRIITTVVSPEWVEAGDKITITRAVIRLRPDCYGGALFAKMTDSEHHVRLMELPPGSRPPPPIMGDITSTWTVPDSIEPGKVTYSSQVKYPCFPFYSWWPVEVELPEATFFVKMPQAREGMRAPMILRRPSASEL